MSQSPYQLARKWAEIVEGIYTPAFDKRPFRDNHPQRYAHRGAGVYGAPSDWLGATGFCAMPLPPYIVLDLDDSTAIRIALSALPQLANTLFVASPKGLHLYVKLDASDDEYWQNLPRSIAHEGKERVSVRGGYWNTYVIGAGSVRSDGGRYEAPPVSIEPLTISVPEMNQLLSAFGVSVAKRPTAERLASVAPILPSAVYPRYIARTFEGAVNDVATAREGMRNNTLYRRAWKLFALVKAGYLSEQKVRSALLSAALASGLDVREILPTLQSAWRSAPSTWRF